MNIAVCYSQLSEGGYPVSSKLPGLKSAQSIPAIVLDMPEMQSVRNNVSNNIPFRYGIYTDTLIDVKSAVKPDIIPGTGKLWRLLISGPDARSIQVVFSKFFIPRYATLFLYDTGMNRIAGAFTYQNSRADSTFRIADFDGNHVVLEYFEPENPEFQGTLIIGSVGQAFTEPVSQEAGPGFININCPIGKDAQLAKHSVCKMAFRSGDFQVTCSGALINNAENDGTPYFLTANHCLSTQDEAASLITYFNYEVAGCDGELGSELSLSGATLLATGQPSDFTLLELDEIPPPQYQPYYAGWDARNDRVDRVTGIHIPFNESKKISLEYDSIYSNPVTVIWDDDSRSPEGSHWIIGFDDGGTSQGSSGSPLFNSLNQIIGQLHGGDDEMAYYGKFSYSYTYKSPRYHTIRHYLDPDSTGTLSVLGYSPSDNFPDAFFTTQYEEVCHNTPITFIDNSVFGPFERKWSVFPATHTFSSGTSDTSSSPVIEFLQDTIYTVKLDLAVGGTIRSTELLEVKSGDIRINVESGSTSSDFCDCDFESIELTANGADSFAWSVSPESEPMITLSNSSGNKTTVNRIPAYESDSSYTIGIIVSGSQSTCSDTALINYNLIKQVNDDIEDAIELGYGISKYYSNLCASIQDGEPIPPFISCTGQNSWCDEYGTGENIVENSVWFKFVASSTGIVSISSTGMDNELALYEADSYQDILSGDYIILGANDDRSTSDYRPLIMSEIVQPGKTYWIQVDGSGGGLEDDFYISISELTATAVETPVTEGLVVYPQPSADLVYIYHDDWLIEQQVEIVLFNATGIIVSASTEESSDGTITIDTSGLPAGFYFVAAKTGHKNYAAQIVKR